MLHIPGYTFPVKELYLEEVLDTIRWIDQFSYVSKMSNAFLCFIINFIWNPVTYGSTFMNYLHVRHFDLFSVAFFFFIFADSLWLICFLDTLFHLGGKTPTEEAVGKWDNRHKRRRNSFTNTVILYMESMIKFFVFFCCYPAGNYIFKVNNRNTRTYFTLCSCVSVVNFEQVNSGWVAMDCLARVFISLDKTAVWWLHFEKRIKNIKFTSA